MYAWLESILARERRRRPVAGADPVAILALERDLGVPMPPSWRAFVLRWNGCELLGRQVLSIDGIREWHRKNGAFERWRGYRKNHAETDEFYDARPVHHLVFAELADGEVLAFDTRPVPHGEYTVHRYDAETADEVDQPEHPSFEAWLLARAVDSLREDEAKELVAMMQARGWWGDRGKWAGGTWWHR